MSSASAPTVLGRSSRHALLMAMLSSSMLLGTSAMERKLQAVPEVIFGDDSPAVGTSLADVECGIFFNDVDFAQNDLGEDFLGDPVECRSACYAEFGCSVLTATSDRCFLKSGVDQQVVVELEGAVAYKLCPDEIAPIAEEFPCGEWQECRDFIGNDLGNDILTDSDAECATHCENTQGCSGAGRLQDGGRCFPKALSPAPNAQLIIDERLNAIRICPEDQFDNQK